MKNRTCSAGHYALQKQNLVITCDPQGLSEVTKTRCLRNYCGICNIASCSRCVASPVTAERIIQAATLGANCT